MAHNAVAMHIVSVGYGYPVEEVDGTTGTMKLTLPNGDVHVNMEMWRINMPEWYQEYVVEKGQVVDLAGNTDPNKSLPAGSKGQVIDFAGQGFYVPTYMIEGDAERGIKATAPGLRSVFDLPRYKHLLADPSEPDKGVALNCVVDWYCQKINRAKWHAYGLYNDYNFIDPWYSADMVAGITGPYEAGEPFLAYYWEPTSVVNLRDLTLLEEPAWSSECQEALEAAIVEKPYRSTVGCGFPTGDVHTGVHAGLVERAPEVTEFLANLYIGAEALAEMEQWKIESGATWSDAAINYLRENRAVWTTWITGDTAADIIAKVDESIGFRPGGP